MFDWLRVIRDTCMAGAPADAPVWPPEGIALAGVPLYAWLALGCLVINFGFALLALPRPTRNSRAMALGAGIAFVLGFLACSAIAVQSDTAPIGQVGLFYLWGSFLPVVLIGLILMALILVAALRGPGRFSARAAVAFNLVIALVLALGWSAVMFALSYC